MSLSPIRRPSHTEPASVSAARWLLRQEHGVISFAEQNELEAWLSAHPAHSVAYEDAAWALDAIARHAGAPELMALREGALAARDKRRPHYLGWGGIGGAIAASLLGVWLWMGAPQTITRMPHTTNVSQATIRNHAEYATAVGERLTVTLPDNSVVTLDTDSKIRLVYSNLERGVELLKGQALFEVAHEKRLPFQVYAAGQRITAVGTSFNVRLDGATVKVALLEGVIRVRRVPLSGAPTNGPARELVMRPGEAAELQPMETTTVRSTDVDQIASWRSGELVFNETRLADAVAEINRYTAHPIVIANSQIGDFRITGVFRSSDPERFSEAMSQILPVDVVQSTDGALHLKARS